MNVKKHTAKLVKASQTNFYYAFLFLPKKKRDAIFAAYAFSRHTDDIVDEAPSRDQAQDSVTNWRKELHACYHGHPTHPIAINLQHILNDFAIPQIYFEELISGVEMDLHQNRYQTFDELYQYCYRVASVVGLICIEIFGYSNPQTKDYAINLGLALQITNIMRDVETDFEQDRIYIPQDDLQKHAYTEDDLANKIYNQNFRNMMQDQATRAHGFYKNAENLLPKEDRALLFPAEIMGKIYGELLTKIELVNFDIFTHPIRVTNPQKLAIALTYWMSSWFKPRRKKS